MTTNHTQYNNNKKDYFRCIGVDNNFYNLYDRNITYLNKPYVLNKVEKNASTWINMNVNFVSCSNCQTVLFKIENSKNHYYIFYFKHYSEVEAILERADILKYFGSTNFGSDCFSFINKMRKTQVQSGFLIITDIGAHPTDPFLNIELIFNRWSLPKTKTLRNRFSHYRGHCPSNLHEVKRLKSSLFVMCPKCHQGPVGIHSKNLRSTIMFLDEDITLIELKKSRTSPPVVHHRLVLNKL